MNKVFCDTMLYHKGTNLNVAATNMINAGKAFKVKLYDHLPTRWLK